MNKRIVLETASVVLDVGDIEREARFWGAMLGEMPGPLRGEGGWLTVGSLDSTTALILQKVPESKVVKNRCHVCFIVPNVEEAIRRIVELGGSPVSEPRQGGRSHHDRSRRQRILHRIVSADQVW